MISNDRDHDSRMKLTTDFGLWLVASFSDQE
jgi:hypothetical protein